MTRGPFIREWMQFANLTPRQLAAASGLTEGRVRTLLKPDPLVRVSELRAISTAVQIIPGILLDVDPSDPVEAGRFAAAILEVTAAHDAND